MKVRRMVERLFAVTTGVAMLGATAMGAMAANLNEYPEMFVSDGTFNGYFVVGENAKPIDNLAMTDIATTMKTASGSGTTTTSVSGDAWEARSGSDVLEFSESLGPATNGVVDFLDSGDLGALADGTFTSSQGNFDYEQFLHFDTPVINTSYEEDDDDVTALFVKIADGKQFARYEFNFLESAESDIDASESFKLDDYEDKTITMFGKTFDIVKAVTGGAYSQQVTLTLMAGSTSDTLLEGETKTYTVGGKDYEITLSFTDDSNRAKFIINGESTPLMDESDTETLSDGTVMGLSQVLYQNYAGGIHSADFFLGADKMELQDDNITLGSSTDELKVNDETVDGSDVVIVGSMLDDATSATEDGELEIDYIWINMTSQDDYFVAAGETLSGQAELDEKDLLFSGNWDIKFEGMDSSVETDVIKVNDKSGEKAYEITFTNTNGDEISVPFAYASGATAVRLGDQNDVLRLGNYSALKDEDYFILNDDSDEDSITHVVQYKGSDDNSKSDPKIKFKVLATGEIVERPVTFGTGVNGATATLKLSGTTYTVTNSSVGFGGSTSAKDWNITISGQTVTYVANHSTPGAISESNWLIADGGAKIGLSDYSTNATTSGQISFNVSLIDSDMTDDVLDVDGTAGVSSDLPYLVFSANISVASTELDMTGRGGITLVSPDDDDDNSYGYTKNGAWVKYTSPSGGGTSADTVEIDWPRKLRRPMVYVTSGATTTATSTSGGAMMAVAVVDATKLDSEVASVWAQNVVAVGGPCVNSVSAELMGNPSDCTEGFTPGKARVKLFEKGDKVAMLVAGYSGADTRLAGKVLAHRAGDLSGMEVEIEGTTYSDATIGAPSPVAVAPVADEPAAEE